MLIPLMLDSATTEQRNVCTPQAREGGDCLKNASDGFLFVFDGGAPGWQEAGEPPTVETEILISDDGASVLEVVYNGDPR